MVRAVGTGHMSFLTTPVFSDGDVLRRLKRQLVHRNIDMALLLSCSAATLRYFHPQRHRVPPVFVFISWSLVGQSKLDLQ